jgi:hypothetical protein
MEAHMARLSITAATIAFREEMKPAMRYVYNEAVQDVVEGAQTPQRAISKGAESFEVGKIPVADADLINSLHIDTAKVGQDIAALGGLIEPGTIQTFEWQEPYAARIEFGFSGTDELGRNYEQAGRFFVGANAEKFTEFVEKHKREVGL